MFRGCSRMEVRGMVQLVGSVMGPMRVRAVMKGWRYRMGSNYVSNSYSRNQMRTSALS